MYKYTSSICQICTAKDRRNRATGVPMARNRSIVNYGPCSGWRKRARSASALHGRAAPAERDGGRQLAGGRAFEHDSCGVGFVASVLGQSRPQDCYGRFDGAGTVGASRSCSCGWNASSDGIGLMARGASRAAAERNTELKLDADDSLAGRGNDVYPASGDAC
jgi:hypothetical protein